jgi:hypothetical protein
LKIKAQNTHTSGESKFNHIFIEFEKYMILILITDVQWCGFHTKGSIGCGSVSCEVN